MNIKIGKNVRQPQGFLAFVPHTFPQKKIFDIPQNILLKNEQAMRLIGKLDGITYMLPDLNSFLHMFVMKDAATSSQIEGTRATLIDALEYKSFQDIWGDKDTDVFDIFYYIRALNYGLNRIKRFPLSLRFIREIHKQLMMGARSAHFSNPGKFRKTQNYIGGTKPDNAHFVPPPAFEMNKALSDFEKFLHEEKMIPLIHIGILHAQFETIHPFLDGNGRVGRLLITLLCCHKKILEKPILFLSSWFVKHRDMYYQTLNDYHDGKVENWINFFLDAVIETAEKSIDVSKKIMKLRDNDMGKIQALGKRESESGVKLLLYLFEKPFIDITKVMNKLQFTRGGAQKVVDRFVDMDILQPVSQKKYSKVYIYKRYVNIFRF